MLNFLKKIYVSLITFFYKPKLILNLNKKINKLSGRKKIIFMLTPEFGNIGDHAIYQAQLSFFKENYSEFDLLEITYNESFHLFPMVSKTVDQEDIIILMGGGSFGDLYPRVDIERRKIITTFINNKIIQMPQSINYSATPFGIEALNEGKKVYSMKHLTLLCRDEKSYHFAKLHFDNDRIFLLPDIVLYWDNKFIQKISNRNDTALLLFRNDKEKSVSDDVKINMFDSLKKNHIQFIESDTHLNRSITGNMRLKVVQEKLKQIQQARFVITDRYHGVIFSVITHTPCIVFKSKDHKIEEGIKWFKKLNYIIYLNEENSIVEFSNSIKKIFEITDSNIKTISFEEKFITLFNEII